MHYIDVLCIFCADAGKSTIGGQILFLSGQVDDRTIQKYEKEAKDKSRESWYFLQDKTLKTFCYVFYCIFVIWLYDKLFYHAIWHQVLPLSFLRSLFSFCKYIMLFSWIWLFDIMIYHFFFRYMAYIMDTNEEERLKVQE